MKRLFVLLAGLSFLFYGCEAKKKREDQCASNTAIINYVNFPYHGGDSIKYENENGNSVLLHIYKLTCNGKIFPYTTRCVINKNAAFKNDSMDIAMYYSLGTPTDTSITTSGISLRGTGFDDEFQITNISYWLPQGNINTDQGFGIISYKYLADTSINGHIYKYVYAINLRTDSIFSYRKYDKYYFNNIDGLIGMVEKNSNAKWFLK